MKTAEDKDGAAQGPVFKGRSVCFCSGELFGIIFGLFFTQDVVNSACGSMSQK